MWDKDPVLFADVVAADVTQRVKNIGTDMLTAIVQKSPVDTSRFVSNTNVSINQADDGFDVHKRLGRSAAMAQGLNTINSLSSPATIYITNTTHYGKYLELGRSSQSPNGVYHPVFVAISAMYRR
ncbi:hypothetical protein B0181_10555 [Moraxella caviae]|uniref:Uncharacterized protein n=1 Tax=Moraxella caviae TaxID=34060 RepID=A0A1S9ZUU6_9GAMM|nr:hypothetical protein [Moraxella caviae]OOR87282.1 hypothetical protein B0181_10555 [Moraxella caviae]STZ14052.1 Uncharacterised protein [Moraxella caviae]